MKSEETVVSKEVFNGSCLCGEVAYRINPPFLFFHHCHCSRCRKTSGSAYAANILVRSGQFHWTRGEDRVQRYELPEAKAFCAGFCPKCGSSMPWVTRSGKAFLVPAGTLDDDPTARPEKNIFWESRAPWFTEVASLPILPEGG